MQRGGNELFAAARFTFDQDGKRRIRVLAYLLFELGDGRSRADDARFGGLRQPLGRRDGARLEKKLLETLRLAGLRDEFNCAERAGVARVVLVVLAGQNQDFDVRRERQQFVDQPETLVRTVRGRWQPKIDQCQLGWFFQL